MPIGARYPAGSLGRGGLSAHGGMDGTMPTLSQSITVRSHSPVSRPTSFNQEQAHMNANEIENAVDAYLREIGVTYKVFTRTECKHLAELLREY